MRGNSRPRPEVDVAPRAEPSSEVVDTAWNPYAQFEVLPEAPHTLNPWAPAFFPMVPLPPEVPGGEEYAAKASQEGQQLPNPLEERTPTEGPLGFDPLREGGSATMQKLPEMEGSLQLVVQNSGPKICPKCCLRLGIEDFGHGKSICLGCC